MGKLHDLAQDPSKINEFQALLETEKEAINEQNNDLETPLHLAIRARNEAAVMLLLQHKAKVTIPDLEGNTALLLAVDVLSVESCRAILDAGAKINFQNRCGTTALFSAAFLNKKDNLKLLLDRGANPYLYPHRLNKSRFNLIDHVANKDYPDCFLILLKYGLYIDSDVKLRYSKNAILNNDDNTKDLLAIGLSINGNPITNETPGFRKSITTLEQYQAKVNSFDMNQLNFYALAFKNILMHSPNNLTIKKLLQMTTAEITNKSAPSNIGTQLILLPAPRPNSSAITPYTAVARRNNTPEPAAVTRIKHSRSRSLDMTCRLEALNDCPRPRTPEPKV